MPDVRVWRVTSLAVMRQFGRDRVVSGHHADIVDRSKMTHNVGLQNDFGATQQVKIIAELASPMGELRHSYRANRATLGLDHFG
jgi:hypothetical protein